MQMIQVALPEPARLVPLETTRATRLSGFYGRELMRLLDLAMYRDEDPARVPGVWVGLTMGDIHNHDRWFFYGDSLGEVSTSTSSWQWLRLEPGDDERRGYPGVASLDTWLESQQRLVERTNAWRERLGQAPFKPGEALALYSLLRGMSPGALAETRLAPDADMSDLHDLLHHVDVWRERHPEFGDVPQDLLQRMHGFMPPAEGRGIVFPTVPVPS